MTRQETGIIMDILTAAYPRFYSGVGAAEMRNIVNLWAEMFAGDDVAMVASAVKALIGSDEKGFPPVVGQVKARVNELTRTTAALPGSVAKGNAKEAAWMRRYITADHGGLGRISRYAREHGMTWEQAKEALG